MFIRSVSSGGGYRGDVNTSFRQGRQDAYRDYIDNFNFALKADAANNAENQRQVERVAKNYGLNLGMDQATRQDAYNFITQSSAIDNAKTQMGIDFQRNAHLKDPTVQAELGKAQASEQAAKTQSGAVQANYGLADWNFKQEQQPIMQQTAANNNQAGLTRSETNQTTANIANQGATNQQALLDMANSFTPEQIERYYIERMNALNPDHGMTLDQLKAEARNSAVDLRMELAKQEAAKNVAAIKVAGGNIDGGVYTFDPSAKGNPTKVTSSRSSTASPTKTETDAPKPVVSTVGKVSTMSQDDFDKNNGNMVQVSGYGGVYKYGNSIVVQNRAGGYNIYAPHVYSVGKDKQYESENELLSRALQASGRAGEGQKVIGNPVDMR